MCALVLHSILDVLLFLRGNSNIFQRNTRDPGDSSLHDRILSLRPVQLRSKSSEAYKTHKRFSFLTWISFSYFWGDKLARIVATKRSCCGSARFLILDLLRNQVSLSIFRSFLHRVFCGGGSEEFSFLFLTKKRLSYSVRCLSQTTFTRNP